jgi:hypothetical protein
MACGESWQGSKRLAGAQRYVVWLPGPVGWRFGAAVKSAMGSGGRRTMHELAVAIAATGRQVELRGDVDFEELELLGSAAGAMPELPSEPRSPGPDDVVLMAEGYSDPSTFGYLSLSAARLIVLILAPPGLFGWPFVDGWSPPSPETVRIETLARAEHFGAAARLGFELWSPMPQMASRVEAAGLDCEVIGNGRPAPYPTPLPKRYDVVTLADNRWAELARTVARNLEPSVRVHEIPSCANEQVLTEFGRARVLLLPSRIEGHCRVAQEARAMGAVPVALDTNPYAVGLDDAGGAVTVSTLEEMPAAVTQLLDDPRRLGQLAARAMKTARAQVDWNAYVARVDAALSRRPVGDPARAARGEIGRSVEAAQRAAQEELEREIQTLTQEVARLERERGALADQLARTHDRLRTLCSTRAWRLATFLWRSGDGALRRARRSRR